MSNGITYLHSHSGIERDLKMPKHIVLVDEKYKDLFIESTIFPFEYNGVKYYKVPIQSFLLKNGVFKNLQV